MQQIVLNWWRWFQNRWIPAELIHIPTPYNTKVDSLARNAKKQPSIVVHMDGRKATNLVYRVSMSFFMFMIFILNNSYRKHWFLGIVSGYSDGIPRKLNPNPKSQYMGISSKLCQNVSTEFRRITFKISLFK